MWKKKKKISFLILFPLFLLSCDSKSKVWEIFQEDDLLHHPPAKRCADCHQNIYNQWRDSRHAAAWISESYKKATNNYSKTKCLACHAPFEMSLNEKPKLRDIHQEDGVNCVSCHFSSKDNSMHGPYDVFSPPHPSTKDNNFRKSLICASCHKETFNQWKETKVKNTCQSCHMKPIKKDKLIQKFPFNYLHFSKYVYNHKFPTGKAKESDIDIKVVKKDNVLSLILINKGIPHNFPTADNGKPKVYIEVLFMQNGKEIEKQNYLITVKYGLEYNKKEKIDFIIFNSFDSIKINIYRKLSWQKEKILIKSTLIKFQ